MLPVECGFWRFFYGTKEDLTGCPDWRTPQPRTSRRPTNLCLSRRLAVTALFTLSLFCGDRGLPPRADPDTPWFVDRAQQSGLNFVHFNGMSGRFYYAEIIGPGVALFDYDSDGDLDVFLVQGKMLGSGVPIIPPPAGLLQGRLYRNDLVVNPDGTKTPRFTDVTAQSGIAATGYGMGVATGDFDNDGDVDLYLTNFGANQLWRNNGDGTFTDVTRKSGTESPGWSVSAAFVDYDRDGW